LLRETTLEETIDLAGLSVNVDVEVAGSGGETGDGLDVGSECISDDLISKNWERVMREKILQVTGTSGHADISNGDNKA
jgi:hypothetical protein